GKARREARFPALPFVPAVRQYRLSVLRRWLPIARRREQRLKHVLYATAQQYGVLIETMEVMPDHVHLFVTSGPRRCVAEIVNRVKGVSSRILRQEFPHRVSRMPTLWSRSYDAGTVGHAFRIDGQKIYREPKGKIVRKTFKYRLYPTRPQTEALLVQRSEACRLYNAALQERIEAYRTHHKSINYYDPAAQLTDIRKAGDLGLPNGHCAQDVLRRLEKAFKAFFQRIQRG